LDGYFEFSVDFIQFQQCIVDKSAFKGQIQSNFDWLVDHPNFISPASRVAMSGFLSPNPQLIADLIG
jgi:hypothetical protein